MSQIVGASIETPKVTLDAEAARVGLGALLPTHTRAALSRSIEESRIKMRHVVAEPAELASLRTQSQRDEAFLEHAVPLGASVTRSVLAAAGRELREVSALISVSSTAFMVPSLDAVLIRELGLPSSTRRIPINQLGCSGGVAALGLAAEMAGPIRAGTSSRSASRSRRSPFPFRSRR
jgi:predicted naringenin-chalcone synthase